MTEIKDRIRMILEHYDMSQGQFSKKTGLSPGYANNPGGTVTKGTMKKISDAFPDINMVWFQTGEGGMLKNKDKLIDIEEQLSYHEVPLLPVSAIGGTLSGFYTQILDTGHEKIISPIKDVDFAITVTGDSMAPEYPNGSRIFIKKINEKAFIDWGRTYVLDTVNGVVIKNIYPAEDPLKVVCRSINTDYPDFEVEMTDGVVFGVYRVLLCLSMK